MTETREEQDELIARLSTENANLRSTNAALADHRAKLLTENANLKEHKQCCNEWLDKTQWIQSAPWATQYLGLHRADGMRQRVEALETEVVKLRGWVLLVRKSQWRGLNTTKVATIWRGMSQKKEHRSTPHRSQSASRYQTGKLIASITTTKSSYT